LVSSIIGIALNRSFVRGPQELNFEYSDSDKTLRQIPKPLAMRYPAFETIGILEVKKTVGTNSIVLVDGRSRQDYENGHLPGAYHLSVPDFEKEYPWFSQRFPKNTRIIIYCRGGDCSLSRRMAELLYDKGYTRLQIFSGGYNEWFINGNPIEKGRGHSAVADG
jgi:rhodanese-related sulfurtransferase